MTDFLWETSVFKACANMPDTASEHRSESLNVPWSDAVRFIRQLSHDLRNHLNAIELQSTYIGELTEDAELKGEIKRLREMISGLTSILQNLSRGLVEVNANLISYRAADFVEDLRKRIDREFPERSDQIVWDVQPGDAVLHVDPELLQQAFIELFENAFQHERREGALVLTAKVHKGRFLFALHEPKARFEGSTENWGREPLQNIHPGHYGLGLNRVGIIVEANGAEIHAQYDRKSAALVTTLALPISGGSHGSA
jgi:K+-sensing histidine kinase KdpD